VNQNHKQWMLQALAAADARSGRCAPNPAVGAVVVSASGELIATGCHWASGHPHAEVDALEKAGEKAAAASLYVTLEPCSHTGKTPPCTQAIIDAGIAHVYYAYGDPNPRVSGSGADVLTAARIPCQLLALDEVDRFYRSYAHWLSTGRPRIVAKLAQTDDGMTARANGQALTITGPEAAVYTANGRRCADAILTTATTVLADDPRLNCRLTDRVESRPVYVLDSTLRFPTGAKLLQTAEEVVLLCRDGLSLDSDAWPVNNVRCLPVAGEAHALDWKAVADVLGAEGLHSVWVEAGPTAFRSLLESELLSEAVIYRSSQTVGEGLPGVSLLHPALAAAKCEESQLGDDTMYRFCFASLRPPARPLRPPACPEDLV
jgi:diaminohydroxyphosphoribosylaminopyrimidine deaminase / 5-amino-6-(5-phosphoribosylamino)uracil reductase